MISIQLARPARPRIVAVFSFRYDAHLVPDLIANIAPLVDGWIAYDDRASTDLFSNELQRRRALLQTAIEIGADWALAVDPDERFETRLAGRIGALLDPGRADSYSFALRELFRPDAYRSDGVWGRKRQARLLSLAHGLTAPEGHLHTSWAGFIPGTRHVATPYNLYHLKMITAERRQGRAALYNHLDPGRQSQAIGYDYLADDRGIRLTRIPRRRRYAPPHAEDGGLWMPDLRPD